MLPEAGFKTIFAEPVTVKSPDPATSISDTEIVLFNVNSLDVTVKLESVDWIYWPEDVIYPKLLTAPSSPDWVW